MKCTNVLVAGFVAVFLTACSHENIAKAPIAANDEPIHVQRTECGAGVSIAIAGSRVWGPSHEITKFDNGEYRGYSPRGAVQLQVKPGTLRGMSNGGPTIMDVLRTQDGYLLRGLYAGQFVYIDVVLPPLRSDALDSEVWTASFRSRVRSSQCVGGSIQFPLALARLPIEDQAAIMAMFVL